MPAGTSPDGSEPVASPTSPSAARTGRSPIPTAGRGGEASGPTASATRRTPPRPWNTGWPTRTSWPRSKPAGANGWTSPTVCSSSRASRSSLGGETQATGSLHQPRSSGSVCAGVPTYAYDDFRVILTARADGAYDARGVDRTGTDRSGVFRVPFDDTALERAVLAVAHRRTRKSTPTPVPPPETTATRDIGAGGPPVLRAEELGGALADSLLTD